MEHTDRPLPKIIGLLDRLLVWTSLILGGGVLAFMTVYCAFNAAIMRKTLNAPIIGAEDILIVMLVAIVALSIPLGARTGAHIEIDFVEPYMSPAFASWSMIIVKCAGFVLLAITSWRLWHSGGTAARFGETTQLLLIPYGPFYYLLSVSIGIYAVVLLLDIWQVLRSGKVQKLKIAGDDL
ncbi:MULTISPECIES: TRAP transporter small permease [unclassified Yoonia]|uniref:TRAP transporter small permease n=1 Tax=unclassified Yoonia TaxID=2629118 RepID=UPI002B000B1F|nr:MULTISPECIES: TRAP transporter small permease [unclassified Yoonia]